MSILNRTAEELAALVAFCESIPIEKAAEKAKEYITAEVTADMLYSFYSAVGRMPVNEETEVVRCVHMYGVRGAIMNDLIAPQRKMFSVLGVN
jgi:hypothetical protein